MINLKRRVSAAFGCIFISFFSDLITLNTTVSSEIICAEEKNKTKKKPNTQNTNKQMTPHFTFFLSFLVFFFLVMTTLISFFIIILKEFIQKLLHLSSLASTYNNVKKVKNILLYYALVSIFFQNSPEIQESINQNDQTL